MKAIPFFALLAALISSNGCSRLGFFGAPVGDAGQSTGWDTAPHVDTAPADDAVPADDAARADTMPNTDVLLPSLDQSLDSPPLPADQSLDSPPLPADQSLDSPPLPADQSAPSPDTGSAPQNVTYAESQRFGGTLSDVVRALAMDTAGNIVVAGSFENTVNFGGSPLTSTGDKDIFLASYDSTGAHRWSKRFGSTGADYALGVTVDANGNLTFTGYFHGAINFGGNVLTSAGDNDIFLANYDRQGAHRWSKRFGGALNETGKDVAIDKSNNIFLVGQCESATNFGGGNLTGQNGTDVFLASYDASGAHRWSKRFVGSSYDYARGLAVDASGSIAITGYIQGTTEFGGGPLVRMGGPNSDQGHAIAVDGAGNVTISGYFDEAVDFGGGVLTSSDANHDTFLASYSATGAHRWSKQFTTGPYETAMDMAMDGAGNIIVTGHYKGTVDFGGGLLTSAGDDDIILLSYDSAGAHRWSKRFGGVLDDTGMAVGVDGSGKVIVAGYFEGTVDFGGGALVSAGNSDGFILQLDPQP
ncbi:MAG: SBBP repeat-containing protein [Deltaproteobacteria bacterium]|nr:SBBP repeat-containing protein [Deltaproteobacteria bacterium]